ncbi:MAG: hypothetical protein JOZ77_12810 [Candidatus Eremiobacteraeota bacterium]|nr:hypothetical protein [Candidatus Eremiobacteraeota bacterium]
MKSAVWAFAALVMLPAFAAVAFADSPGGPLLINKSGTYRDGGVWIYRTAAGLYSLGPAVTGTNETLVMPSPSPEAGGALVGVEIIRHPFDTLGYPMRIALVEKLFAASYQIAINASSNGDIWKYEYGDPVVNESPINGKSGAAFKTWGPFHADAVPIAQAPEPEIQAAFDFAKGVLNSIGNLPSVQKNLGNYGVLFVDDGSIVWVEFGPRFGAGEAPHLGCQTQLGRDMVFGYDKKQSGAGTSGKFLQCF